MFKLNKKGISEITSFVLLTLLVITASTVTYFFAKDFIKNSVSNQDEKNILIYFQKIDEKINSIKNFQDSTTSFNLRFKTGQVIFSNNSLIFQSLISYYGNNTCVGNICYEGEAGFERINYNLPGNYTFEENFSLNSGNYNLIFKNLKNESKISVLLIS